MAPECFTGGEYDARSDLYSLGLLMYSMIYGTPAFSGAIQTVMYKQVNESPVYTDSNNNNRELIPIIQKLLSKDKKDRFQTAQELKDEIHKINS